MTVTCRFLVVLPLFGATAFSIGGCSAARSLAGLNGSDSQFQVQVQNSVPVAMDQGVGRTSEGLHSFLAGQLAYDKENYGGALKNFSKARELFGEGQPFLGARLAELYVREGKLTEALQESESALKGDPQDVDLALLHAGILAGLGKTAESEAAYEKIIVQHPKKLDPYILLASMQLRRGATVAAEKVIVRVLHVIPGDPVARYYQARVLEAKGDLKGAEKIYQAVFAAEPSRFQGAPDLIRVLLKQKKYAELRVYCQELVERDPKHVVARKILTQLHVDDNNLAGAVEQLTALEALESDPTDTRFTLALLFIEQQNFREALRELNLVLAARPNHGMARYYLGSLYAGLGQRQEAVDELLKIPRGDAVFVKGRLFAAFMLRQEGDLAQAEVVSREALEAEPTNENVISYLVLVLREARRFDAALEILETALSKGETEKLLFNYALVLQDSGKSEESLSVMERVIAQNPRHGDGLNFIAFALAEQGRQLARAEELIRRALAISPRDGYYVDTLGWIQFRRGDLALSETNLEQAVLLTDGDPVVLDHLGDAQRKGGDLDKARRTYERALVKSKGSTDVESKGLVRELEKKLKELGEGAP